MKEDALEPEFFGTCGFLLYASGDSGFRHLWRSWRFYYAERRRACPGFSCRGLAELTLCICRYLAILYCAGTGPDLILLIHCQT